jgi:hypothetical protein
MPGRAWRRVGAVVVAWVVGCAAAAGQEAVDPAAVIQAARMSATLQQTDLHGTIRKGRERVDLSLFLRGRDIQFALQGGALRFHMRLGDEGSELFEIIDGKTRRFDRARLVEAVAGTDLSYEDLALRFFYWPKPVYEGTERVNGQECWKIRLNNPGRDGDYAVVYVWVHTRFGAFMRIRGHDRQGRMLKQFEVTEVMNVGRGVYTLRKMKVDTLEPATGRVRSSTYLEFQRPAKTDPGGLR